MLLARKMLSPKNSNFFIIFYKYPQAFDYDWFIFIQFLARKKYRSKILVLVKVIIL
ncbi:hypothetical protein SAMN05421827_106247 [Pedobacter terrae]|uniref:Uncharacterized protein n=1 Tax=Pedobacter terrae TaxID=405671 RepID=A0A1G7UC16_9SPHI|nr:hypothetical protein SAMN05421827_106247 [Pedobacter terrae]